MNGRGKSDRSIRAKRPANNNAGIPAEAESEEQRDLTKEKAKQQNKVRTQRRTALNNALERIRTAAEQDNKLRFTALWHHVYDIQRLNEVFQNLDRRAAPGVDGVTWQDYDRHREENLQDLSQRLKRGAYRPLPNRRVQIPKPDGSMRTLGIPALEDKIVQRATAEVLQAIYEVDFMGFSYGYRPGRSQHDALAAVAEGITRKKVNYVLDADLREFFNTLDHRRLIAFIEHRIADQRVIRQLKKWLHAGVLEEGSWVEVARGVPQGGSISPLLANIYLHYALDLWVHQWRQREADGEMIVVRYADDFIVGFQYESDAHRFQVALQERLESFGLSLHPQKTRLIEFGRFAAQNRKARGQGKPATFEFLGFTHLCGKKRNGKFVVRRKSSAKRQRRKLTKVKAELRRRLHWNPHEVGQWLKAVLEGHYNYHGVPLNIEGLKGFKRAVERLWYHTLLRRSQRANLDWDEMRRRFLTPWLPEPSIRVPWPSQLLDRSIRGRSPVR